jgi:hypothetical protein
MNISQTKNALPSSPDEAGVATEARHFPGAE